MRKILFLSLFVFMLAKADNKPDQKASDSQPGLLKKFFLYAPWRQDKTGGLRLQPGECVFCKYPKQDDKEQFILKRHEIFFIALGRFPYTKGHLLIIPYKHVKEPTDLTDKEGHELMDLIKGSLAILNRELKPKPAGANVGINLGEAAGASVPGHLHIHIVPRYKNDTGFVQLIGNTSLASIDLNRLYEKLKGPFKKIKKTE